VKLVVGLGTPGKKYERTRHNLGFLVVDHIAGQNAVSVKKKLCDALVGEWPGDREKIVLVKPQNYVNRSGESVRGLLRKFHATPEDLVVVYDDLDLPFGRIRIRPQGSAGGHRGMISITESLAQAPFFRVRVGIGRPPAGMDSADYVLEPFGAEEKRELGEVIARASEAVVLLLEKGGQRAMEQFNRATT
jgi:PTH1 family peptidyl-tRNA hydrolase